MYDSPAETRTFQQFQPGVLYVVITDETGRSGDTNIPFLKPEQVEAMRDAAHEGRQSLRDDALVTLLYDTGLRRVRGVVRCR
jgi:site-specific recombinase XerD